MDERQGVSSRPSRPAEVLWMAGVVLLCAVAFPIVLAVIALALAALVAPPVAVVFCLVSGKVGQAVLWAAGGCAFYWLAFVLVMRLTGRRQGPRSGCY